MANAARGIASYYEAVAIEKPDEAVRPDFIEKARSFADFADQSGGFSIR